MVVAVTGEAHGAADGVFLTRAVKAVVVTLVLDQLGVHGAQLEEPRAKQRPQPRWSTTQLHARRRRHFTLSVYQADKQNAYVM